MRAPASVQIQFITHTETYTRTHTSLLCLQHGSNSSTPATEGRVSGKLSLDRTSSGPLGQPLVCVGCECWVSERVIYGASVRSQRPHAI